ncbi:hypothetical protein [Myxosarcina sp. GI1]|uniref:hypothetical protein n=1 Tax=Myxosarcina sp. GI1 TaxID=1541065 RepID=UPI00068AA11C|nr:hypothetical protein [Myxosarcina sp. GI1]
MSKFSLPAIAFLVLSNAAMPVMANEIAPIDLTFKAYQGYFIENGIPSGGSFVQKARLGQIDAETLVRSAIEKQRLSPETINDKVYLQKIDAALFKLERRR